MLSGLRTRLTGLVRPTHLRLGLRAAVAAVASYILATVLHLPNGYWAVITAILVVQSSIGASLSTAIDRLLGTLAGGVIGVACATAAGPSLSLTILTLGVGILLASTLSARLPSYKLAPVTVAIVLLSDPTHAQPLVSGFHRVLEIGVGGVVGVACALLVFPARALLYLFPHCAEALGVCAKLLQLGRDGVLGRPWDPSQLDGLNNKVRAALRAADQRVSEARAERAGRLAHHPDPAPVVRSCRRLWHSVIILLRSARTPLPTPLAERMAPKLDTAVAALATLMADLAGEMRGQGHADPSAALVAAAALESEGEHLAAEGGLDQATGATLTALFSAVSACTQVSQNLVDLSARLAELRSNDT